MISYIDPHLILLIKYQSLPNLLNEHKYQLLNSLLKSKLKITA